MKFVEISAKERLETLYHLAGDTGSNSYEEIAEYYSNYLHGIHGRAVSINFEDIPDKDMKKFLKYIESDNG